MNLDCKKIIDKRMQLWELYHDIDKDLEFREAITDRLLSEDGNTLRDEIYNNPEYLIEMFFIIVNKNQEIVPFFLNDVQKLFLDTLNSDIEAYRRGAKTHLKYLVLKGRQQGFTSFITAYQMANTIVKKNFSGFTVADSSDNTNTIFEDKAKHPYSLLPEAIKPTERYNTRKEMIFEKLNSKWRVATAGNKEIGRSKTINFFHGSEAAFWKSIQSIMGGLGQALTRDSIQILESTANGFNEYRILWSEAEKGENNYTPLFFEWWKTPEYKTDFENRRKENEFKRRVKNASESDKWNSKLKWLKESKGLTWEQLYWYEGKKKDLGELLPQEYPCTALEAFLSSGTPIFDNEKVLKRQDALEAFYKINKPIRGKFIYEYVNEKIIDSTIRFIEDPNGNITIYNKPKETIPYVIGCDTAEGGTDYCVGQVLDNTTGKQVATFRDRIDTDLFAKQMYCLGMYYNEALIGIETNFDLHPTKELERLEYPKQYVRETVDNIGTVVQAKFGFNTNKATRPVIVGNLVVIVRESIELINDIETTKEMMTFINNEGRAEAAEGEHDDCVMSLAIAYAIRGQQSFIPIVEEKHTSILDILPYALVSNEELEQEYDNEEIW